MTKKSLSFTFLGFDECDANHEPFTCPACRSRWKISDEVVQLMQSSESHLEEQKRRLSTQLPHVEHLSDENSATAEPWIPVSFSIERDQLIVICCI